MKDYIKTIPTSTFIPESLKIEKILGDPRYVRLIEDWWFFTVTLGRWSCAPKGFIYDQESVPLFKGTNPEAGCGHDLYVCIDSDPVVPKMVAAKIYLELQTYMDGLEKDKNRIKHYANRTWDFIRRYGKTGIVMVWFGYYHKRKVMATYEEITG